MDIGLHTGALTTSYRGSVGGGAQEPLSLSPLPGILDAPNVIILGASIMDGAFGNNQTMRSSIEAYGQAAGFTGDFHARSQAGEEIAETSTRLTGVQAEPAIAAQAGQNLYLVHTGGNNVSGVRPWPGGQAQFTADYTALMQQITGAGDHVVPMPLTKRLYINAPTVIDGDAPSEANGSKPYNDNIILPAISQFAPDWQGLGPDPFVNPYEAAHRHPQLLSSDGVHGYGASLARYILARTAGRARGEMQGQSRAGTAVLYSTELGEPNDMSIGTINRFQSYGQGNFLNKPWLCGAITQSGTFDPFIELITTDTFQNHSSNAGTGTYARIPDARFHHPDIVNRGIYVQGTKVYELTSAGLTPGDTVTITAVGVRNAGGTNRRGLLSLSTGQSLELDASNIAPSNQVIFDPVTVPASGEITLSLSVAPGSTYGYLHGVMLDFS